MLSFLVLLIKAFFAMNIALVMASFCTWFERKGSALIQDRVGANRAGAFVESKKWYVIPFLPMIRVMGILGVINTLLCDSLKGILKEDFIPDGTSKFMHALGPFLAVLPIIMAFAVIPFAPKFELGGMEIIPQVAPVNAGVLWILAMGSVAVYGVAIAGWTGNNKYALLGALRAAAQMISYELAMGLSIVSVVVCYGTLDLYEIVQRQASMTVAGVPLWGVLLQPLGFIILLVSGMAETKRAPFDLPEAESELTAGYFTEYSGMKFLLFWLGEFAEIALVSFMLALLFFGGWNIPFVHFAENGWLGALIGHAVLMTKVTLLCMLQIVIRWTLPRFRYDQLMNLGWKILLPLSLANLMITATFKVFG